VAARVGVAVQVGDAIPFKVPRAGWVCLVVHVRGSGAEAKGSRASTLRRLCAFGHLGTLVSGSNNIRTEPKNTDLWAAIGRGEL